MKTRDKILEKARILFNEHGLASVSSRSISDELGISYGNLCYHFARKDDIILALYFAMQRELDEEVSNLQAEIFRFDFMVRSLRAMLTVLYKYKFIFLDLSHLARKFPEIKGHAHKQYQRRIEICAGIYDFMMREGYLRQVHIDGHYEKLVHAVLMILNAWPVDAEIYYQGPEEDKIDHYLEMIYRVVSASLTRKGSDAFMELYKNRERLQS